MTDRLSDNGWLSGGCFVERKERTAWDRKTCGLPLNAARA